MRATLVLSALHGLLGPPRPDSSFTVTTGFLPIPAELRVTGWWKNPLFPGPQKSTRLSVFAGVFRTLPRVL